MAKKRKATVLDVMPAQQASRYASSRQIEREEQQQREAAEQRRQAEEKSARDQEADCRTLEYWGNNARELMDKPGVRDDNSGLPLVGEISPTAGADFITEAEENGVSLSIAAKQRLGTYIEAQHKYLGASVTPDSMKIAFERLRSLEAFAPGEVTYSPGSQEPEPAPAPEKTFEELLAECGTDSPEVKRALHKQVMGVDFAQLAQPWVDNVFANWGVALTDTQILAAWRITQEQNLSPRDPRTYDKIRRTMVSTFQLPAHCLTVEESLNKELDKGEIDIRTWRQRTAAAAQEGKLDRPVSRV